LDGKEEGRQAKCVIRWWGERREGKGGCRFGGGDNGVRGVERRGVVNCEKGENDTNGRVV
jgi:hypothetical protein